MQAIRTTRPHLAERVNHVYQQEPIGMAATVVNGAILAFMQWHYASHPAILTWYGLLMAITALRLALRFRFLKGPATEATAPAWRRTILTGLGLSGLTWGMAGFLLFPAHDPVHQVFTAFVLGGMVAGAAATFAALEGAFFLFSLPCLLPILLQFIHSRTDIHLAMAAMMVIFWILIYLSSKRVQATTWAAILLGHENRDLVGTLSSAVKRSQALNEELQTHRGQLESMVEARTVALRESEEKHRLVVDNAHDGIFVAQGGLVMFANPVLLRMTGYSAEELGRLPLSTFIHHADLETALARDRRLMVGDRIPEIFTMRFRNRSGAELWVETSSVLIPWKGRPATLNFVRDLTERRELEAQLQIARKMEAIGTLAGGVAHDFNNLLMSIQGTVSLMLDERPPGHPEREQLESIETSVRSGAELTRQLLGLARGGKYEARPVDLNQLVEKVILLFGRTHKEIRTSTRPESPLWTVEADLDQLNQVLLNICINAGQAMPEGGDLIVTTHNQAVTADQARAFEVPPGDYVKVVVSDTGFGMDKSILPRIFDPFFTTKGMHQGAGLGLASAYGIIRNHGGFIEVHTEIGRGSSFAVYLPRSRKPSAEGAIPLEGAGAVKTRTALLVEDEPMVAAVGEQLLLKLGFEALVAGSGEQAVEIFRARGKDIDFVLLDMIMPGMGGEGAFVKLREMDPGVNILLSSGYSLDERTRGLLEQSSTAFLQKPYSLKQLAAKLESAFSLKIQEQPLVPPQLPQR